MAVLVPATSRGPYLDLTLPASASAVEIQLRNATTGRSLTLNLPAAWAGEDLTLDWAAKTIRGATGIDRSALLDETDNALWTDAGGFQPGENQIELEVLSSLLAGQDDFNQAAGALNGKAAEKGGNWATSGSATDFTLSGFGSVSRSTTADVGSGRIATLSAISLKELTAEIDFIWTVGLKSSTSALLLPTPSILASVTSDAAGAASLSIGREGVFEVKALPALTLGRTYRLRMKRRAATASAVVEDVTFPSILGTVQIGKLPTTASSVSALDLHTGGSAATRTYDRLRVFGGAYVAEAHLRWEKGYY